MIERRITKVEDDVKQLRLDVERFDGRMTGAEAQLRAQAILINTIQEATMMQRRMIETGERLIEALGWVGKFARWICSIAAFVALVGTTAKVIWSRFL